MTNEKAIVIMENERPHCGGRITFTEEEKCEAYDMAVEALKAEPDADYKTLLIMLENAEDVIRGLKEDLRNAREELRQRW